MTSSSTNITATEEYLQWRHLPMSGRKKKTQEFNKETHFIHLYLNLYFVCNSLFEYIGNITLPNSTFMFQTPGIWLVLT
jgi:hypothetical protein